MIYPTAGKGGVGTRVRVRDLDSVPNELRCLAGTIKQSFGHPDYAAYEVILDDKGYSRLFWHYQLEDEASDGMLRARHPLAVHRST